jgi:hypothetical protein
MDFERWGLGVDDSRMLHWNLENQIFVVLLYSTRWSLGLDIGQLIVGVELLQNFVEFLLKDYEF